MFLDTMCGYDYGIKVGAADVYYSSFDHIGEHKILEQFFIGLKVGYTYILYKTIIDSHSLYITVIPNSQCPITTAANAIANLPEASSVDRYCGTQFM